MGKKLLAALIAMVLGFFPGTPKDTGGQCRCLAVGMDLFISEESTVPCSENNAEIMAALFAAYLPEGTRVNRSVNGPGSADALEAKILDVFAGAREGDTSILYLSTHGILWEEPGGGSGSALILSDGVNEEAIEAGRLRQLLDRIPGRKVLILDCCHAGAIAKAFDGPQYCVIAGCGADEECYFMAAGGESGRGYFTAALENALRASDREQIDPDGDGRVTLGELAARMREIYGISGASFLPEGPEGDQRPLFFLPEDRGEQERLFGLAFDPAAETEGQVTLSFHFRTDTAVKLEYRLVPLGADGWDFEHADRLPDRERTGQTRGLLSPGEKDRTIKVSRDKLGESGEALLEIISMRGMYRQVPVPEATRVIRVASDQ